MRPRFEKSNPSSLPIILAAFVFAACAGEAPDTEEPMDAPPSAAVVEVAADMTVQDAGFSTPESVLHDPMADVYLVSNINGAPLDADDNGFISRLAPDGEVLDLKWIDGGAEGVTLNAPKGMAISNDQLFVADIDCLRVFDLTTGEPLTEHCVEGATFLNDVAADGQANVYFTDSGLDATFSPSGADAIYLLSGGAVLPVAKGDELGRPNGIAIVPGGLRVVTFGSGQSYRVAPTGERTEIVSVAGSLDGVEMMEDNSYLVSSWDDQAIYLVLADGTREAVVEGVEAPADIGFDRSRNRILIPLFNGNAVIFRTLPAR